MSLQVVPITLREAHAFVARVHRHHKPSRGGKFAIGASSGFRVVAVAVVGRPVSRRLQDGGWTAEVLRLAAVEGIKGACSMLYMAAWRACRAMGYRKLITYTLTSEPGTSLKALESAGWRCIGECGGGTWDRAARPRVDEHPTQTKLRWEVAT